MSQELYIIEVECAVCGTDVERLKVFRDYARRSTCFRVYCHGEQDNGELLDEDAMSIAPYTTIRQIAFRIPRLEQGGSTSPATASKVLTALPWPERQQDPATEAEGGKDWR